MTVMSKRRDSRLEMTTRLGQRPAIERLEERCLLDCTGTALTERTFDGTCNNLINPEFGSTNIALLRKAPVAYADGISAPFVGNPPRPSPREISNAVVAQEGETFDARFLSAMVYAFGQFIDHDLDLTTRATPSEPFNVLVPMCDPFFDPACTGTKVITLNRSTTATGTGTDITNPRQQPNVITAFLDASMIYGSDAVTADMLRTHVGGKLKVGPGGLLPTNNAQFFENCAPATPCLPMANDSHIVADHQVFAAGDVRANENVELTSLHTLFVREHNRWAREVKEANPTFNDEQIYQMARLIVAGELQAIAFNEWIPAVFGPNALPAYTGYVDTLNPGVANEFSTGSFRMGHSMLGDDIQFFGNDGAEVAPEIALSEGFFNPPVVSSIGIGPILKYLSSDPSRRVDNMIVDSVRNFLFGPPGAGGFDLASLNMQRGRDHGLSDYNAVRVAYGLAPVSSFAEITSSVNLQTELAALYGNVDNIDLWVGGLAEDHVPGTSTGQLLRTVILDQFQRARDGDRFWYQNIFSGALLDEIHSATLRDIISKNTEISNLQDNVFLFELTIRGTVFHDFNENGIQDTGEPGVPGRNVRLINVENGATIDRTRTNPNGVYGYTHLKDPLRFGTFQVRVVVPPGWIQTTPDPADIVFTVSSDVIANFGIKDMGRQNDPAPELATALRAVTVVSNSTGKGASASSRENYPLPLTSVNTLGVVDSGTIPAQNAQHERRQLKKVTNVDMSDSTAASLWDPFRHFEDMYGRISLP